MHDGNIPVRYVISRKFRGTILHKFWPEGYEQSSTKHEQRTQNVVGCLYLFLPWERVLISTV